MLEKNYEPGAVEEGLYQSWEQGGYFGANEKGTNKPYVIMMPPPNVTGSLHIGHALTFTLQDILIRYHRMTGRDALWQPGTDHAGIATQMVVERQLEAQGLSRRDMGRQAFLDRVWEWKAESGGMIIHQLRRLGASPDWKRERFTMDEGLSKAVRKVFVDLYREKLIYRDKRLVNWDPKLHTAISDLEVENREQKGKMWYFKYPVDGMADTFVTVGTTRPETMLGDTGVAVHPDDDRYKALVGKFVVLPIVGRKIPIVADEYADPEKGSGAVKITPAHDFNDFAVGKRNKLEMINVFDLNAKLNENAPADYQGMDRFKARDKIVKAMEELGLLEKIEDNAMTIPYGDRSGVVIEPWLTDQWYCDAHTLAQPCIKAVETGETRFVPKQWENTFFEWMRNIQPWCISRQLWWGHQIPAWYGPDGEVFVELDEDAAKAAANKHYGKDVELKRDEDVLDTWFSSALWPFSTLGWPDKTPELARYYPGDVLVTGFDIIFFWVARMMMMGMHFMKDANGKGIVPFKDVYIHALVRDEKGQKMSKSKGNVLDPLDLCNKYGTDAVRFTLTAMAAQGRDIKLSEQRIAGYRNFITKIWNATRFAQMNECKPVVGFDPKSVTTTLNKWIVGKTAEAASTVAQAIEAYRFNDAADGLYRFTWGSFCDWFLEFAKPVFQGTDEKAKAETRATAAWVIEQILHIGQPIIPFVTEELWDKLGQEYGIARPYKLIEAKWPTYAGLTAPEAEAEIDWVIDVISSIRSVRSEMNIVPGQMLKAEVTSPSAVAKARLATHSALICANARLSEIAAVDAPTPGGSAQVIVGDTTLMLPLEGIIDLAKERDRLKKEIAKAEKDIEAVDKKLGNEAFVSKAPPEIIEENHERRRVAVEAKTKLSEALARIG
ncbi:MAG: valine--tRNA ligase [Rhodospirillaceae bacterium]|nr:valine--tRNA ligase [Rhodospirillaceae bacterium]